jgi:hypothetical protein
MLPANSVFGRVVLAAEKDRESLGGAMNEDRRRPYLERLHIQCIGMV